MKRALRRLHWASFAMLTSAGAVAQTTDTGLEEVVVTATGYEQQLAQAPASISVVTREQLEKRPFVTLQDAVRDLEGVSVVGGDPNSTDIVIRGMPGEYTLIMVDGRRQNTRETMNRGTGGVQSNLIPPLAAIERIEVVRGPMSSLYGSDAMGGVINVITRKVPEKLGATTSLGGIVQEDSDHGDSQLGELWIAAPLADDRIGVHLYGGFANRDEDDIYYPLSFTAGANEVRDHNINGKVAFVPSDDHSLVFEGGYDLLEYKETPGLSAAPTGARIEDRHRRTHVSGSYEGHWSFGDTRLAIYRENEKFASRSNGVAQSEPDLANTVVDASVTMPFGMHTATIGGQYIDTRVENIALQDVVSRYPNVDRATRKSWALFAEDQLKLTDSFTVTAGARVDDYDQFGSHFTPRLYVNYSLTSAWTLRGGVAKGFRAPTLRQTTAGYCMSTGGGSLVRGPLCGNPELDPETSTTTEAGIRYAGARGTAFGVTLYRNNFKNKVVSFDSGQDDPRDASRPLYVYDNVDRVVIKGVEVSGTLPFTDQLRLSANYTYTDSERRGSGEPAFDGSSLEGLPLDMTPEHALNAKLTWNPIDRLSLDASGYYTGEQYYTGFRNGALNARKREDTTTFNLGGSFQLTSSVSIKAAVLNLTDEVVPVDDRGRFAGLDGNWMVDEGRRFWAMASVTF